MPGIGISTTRVEVPIGQMAIGIKDTKINSLC
jgi:hypothetical protein